MDWLSLILSNIVTLLVSCGGVSFFFIRAQKRKAKAEAAKAEVAVKSDEIDNMKKALEDFYNPLLKAQDDRIAAQNLRIKELEAEVKTIREEKNAQELAYQRQIADLQKQVTDIVRTLGIRANKQLRNNKGQYTKAED